MKPLCYAPFVSILSDTYNKYAPCCLSTRRFSFGSIDEYWNSKELNEIRTQLLNQEWPESCIVCKQDREAGLEDDASSYDYLYETLNLTQGVAEVFDYRPSNNCNLKCRMCTPGSSNLIADEIKTHKEIKELYPNDSNVSLDSKEFINYIKNRKIKRLKLLGGEPTIDPETHTILGTLIELGITDMRLHIVTNITNMNSKFFSLLEKFSNVHLKLSIDAIGKPYEYIRTNANWNKVQKYSERLLSENKFKSYCFAPVIMSFNAFDLIPMLDWYHQMYNKKLRFYTNFQTSTIKTSYLSALYNEDLAQILYELECWSTNKPKEFLEAINFKRLHNIISSCKHNPDITKKFVEFTSTLDRIRGTNICNINERFNKYFAV